MKVVHEMRLLNTEIIELKDRHGNYLTTNFNQVNNTKK